MGNWSYNLWFVFVFPSLFFPEIHPPFFFTSLFLSSVVTQSLSPAPKDMIVLPSTKIHLPPFSGTISDHFSEWISRFLERRSDVGDFLLEIQTLRWRRWSREPLEGHTGGVPCHNKMWHQIWDILYKMWKGNNWNQAFLHKNLAFINPEPFSNTLIGNDRDGQYVLVPYTIFPRAPWAKKGL